MVAHFFIFFSIDATEEKYGLGRLINNVASGGNIKRKILKINGKIRVAFVAERDIPPDTQLFYTYGEQDKATLDRYPWLKDKLDKGTH